MRHTSVGPAGLSLTTAPCPLAAPPGTTATTTPGSTKESKGIQATKFLALWRVRFWLVLLQWREADNAYCLPRGLGLFGRHPPLRGGAIWTASSLEGWGYLNGILPVLAVGVCLVGWPLDKAQHGSSICFRNRHEQNLQVKWADTQICVTLLKFASVSLLSTLRN